MSRPRLRLVGPPRDRKKLRRRLPVAWDGHPITWDSPLAEYTVTHPNPEPCRKCGQTRELTAGGYYSDGQVDFWRGDDGRLHRLVAFHRLTLFRCWQCGRDEVYEHDAQAVWDLDDTDYGPDGSWPTQEAML